MNKDIKTTGPRGSKGRKKKKHVKTLKISKTITALTGSFSARGPIFSIQPWKAGSVASTTLPWQNKRMILGLASNEQNMTVIRPFSYRCAIVSAPDPPMSTHAAWFGPKNEKAQPIVPLGETLICDVGAIRCYRELPLPRILILILISPRRLLE